MPDRVLRLTALVCVALWAAVLLTIQGCTTALPASNISVLSKDAVLIDVPFESQATSNLCGLSSLEMLTRYYQAPLTESERKIIRDGLEGDSGVSGRTLVDVLKDAGYDVAVFKGTLDKQSTGLLRHLDHHRPVLVMLAAETGGLNHYVLVVGYDPSRSLVLILDPTLGSRALPYSTFQTRWQKANEFTLLAIPH